MNYIEDFNKHVQETGIEGLLPQNLPINIINRMLDEIASSESNYSIPSTTLLMAVTAIKSANVIKGDVVRVDSSFSSEDELMDNYTSYKMCVLLEAMIRNASVEIPDDSLPTLKNIFNKNRKIQITDLDKK